MQKRCEREQAQETDIYKELPNKKIIIAHTTYNEETRQHTFQQKIKRQKRKYIIRYEIVEVQETRLHV